MRVELRVHLGMRAGMNYHRFTSTLAQAALAGLLPAAVFAQTAPQGNMPNSVDRQFVPQAILANAQEIKDAQVEQYSANPSVRLYARTMIRDHAQAIGQLAAIANQLNI